MRLSEGQREYTRWLAVSYRRAQTRYPLHIQRLEAIIGDKRVEDITLSDIVVYIEWYAHRYSANNTQYAVLVLRSFFRFLSANKLSVISYQAIRVPKIDPHPFDHITYEQYRKLQSAIPADTFRSVETKLILSTLYWTGMRVGELIALNISDLDNKLKYTKIITEKNRLFAYVFWGSETERLIRRYLGIRLAMNQQDYLFCAAGKNRRIEVRTVQRYVKWAGRQIDIDLHPHMLRHSKAHYMFEHGANLTEIQRILRHKNVTSTQRYTFLELPELKEIAKKYNCG